MAMNNVYSFSDTNFAQDAHEIINRVERVLRKQWQQWQMIDFHSIGNVADSHSLLRVCISQDCDSVSSFDKALPDLVHVHLHSS